MRTIIITGPSSSGKTYLTKKLNELFDDSILVRTDSYYRDNILIRILSKFIPDIYDRPLSIKKNEINKTIESIYKQDKLILFSNYDFINQKSSRSEISLNFKGENQFLIIEGIFSHLLDLDYQKTINIVCKEEKNICYERRKIRDQLERGRNNIEVNLKFNRSWKLFYKNIKIFLSKNKVITLDAANKATYEQLVISLQNIKKPKKR